MQRIKNFYMHMNKTKRRTLLFVCLSFLVIIILSFGRNFTTNENVSMNENTKDTVTEKIIVNKENTKKDNVKIETNKKEKQKVKESKQEVDKQEEKQELNKVVEKETTNTQTVKTPTKNKQSSTSKKPKSKPSTQEKKPTQPKPKEEPTKKEPTKEETVIPTYTVSLVIEGYDGVMASSVVTLEEDKEYSCYDVLKMYCDSVGIPLKISGAGISVYIRSINGLAEKQHGPMSGWMYSINGTSPSVGAGSYTIHKNDSIRWYYVSDN